MAMEKMKKMFGRRQNENADGEEKENSQASDGAVGGGEERKLKVADEPRKPRFAESPVTVPAPASAKKKENKVVRVEVPVDGGSKTKTTSVKKTKSIAAPSVRYRSWRDGGGSQGVGCVCGLGLGELHCVLGAVVSRDTSTINCFSLSSKLDFLQCSSALKIAVMLNHWGVDIRPSIDRNVRFVLA